MLCEPHIFWSVIFFPNSGEFRYVPGISGCWIELAAIQNLQIFQ